MQYDGKYASRCAAKPLGGHCAVLPYIQVTEIMTGEDVRKREPAPLMSVRDNYEKIILSLDQGPEISCEGIRSRNIIDWLLAEY